MFSIKSTNKGTNKSELKDMIGQHADKKKGYLISNKIIKIVLH